MLKEPCSGLCSRADRGFHESLPALRAQLRNLEETIASLLQLALAQPEGLLRDQLVDNVSKLDSIANVMRQALDGMMINADGTVMAP